MTPSERAAIGVTDDQKRVRVLERVGGDWRVFEDWAVEEHSHTELLERLAARADLLVHDVHPSEMAGRGLDYERLAAAHPGLVMTSIAPFGLSGPHAGYRGPDVVTWSAGGVAALNGEPSRPDLPPLKAFGDQSGFQAGLNAAVGSLGALFARLATGRGEHVEV